MTAVTRLNAAAWLCMRKVQLKLVGRALGVGQLLRGRPGYPIFGVLYFRSPEQLRLGGK